MDKSSNNRRKILHTKVIFLFSVFLFFTFWFSQSISADVVSLNSGGAGEITINSNNYIGGYHPDLGFCGDGILEPQNGEQCDDGGIISGDGCSSSCQTETVEVAIVTTPGGGGGITFPKNILVEPTNINLNLIVNTTSQKTVIRITNFESYQVTVGINQQNLNNRIIVSGPGLNDTILGTTSLIIPPKETVELGVEFRSFSEPGILWEKYSLEKMKFLFL